MADKQVKIGVGFNVDKSGLNELRRELQAIQQMKPTDIVNTNNIDKATADLKEAQEAAKVFQGALEKSFNAKLGTSNIATFNKELGKSGQSLTQLQQSLYKAGPAGVTAFRSMTAELLTTNKYVKQTSQWIDKMSQTLSNTVRWTVASTAINSITGSVQKAYNFTKQLDNSLNDIRIVTEKSADEMARFATQANKAAKNLGASTKAYSDASLIYYQQGLGEQDVQARANVTTKVSNVTGQSTGEVSEQLTAVWNGYKVDAAEAELYIDKLSAVAASTAADLEELSTGMSKVASAANIMGVDIDQLNAQLATIVSITREAPESIGTALKTVYARMSDIQAGLDEETTLDEYTQQMAQMGVNVLNAQGQLRDMGAVVEEIGSNWDNLTRAQQVSLAQTIAGTRQYSRMMALFDNWEMYESAKSTSQDSAGTLQKQQDIYMESTEAHLAQLSAEAEDLYQTLLDPKGINTLIDALKEVVNLADNFAESIGGGAGVLRNFGAIAFNVFNKQIASGITRVGENVKGFFGSFDQESSMNKMMEDLRKGYKDEIGKDVSDETLQKMIAIKKRELELEGLITEEEKKQFALLIKQTAEADNQIIDLKAQEDLIKKAYIASTGEAVEDLTNDNIGEITSQLEEVTAENDKYIQSTKESFAILDELISKSKIVEAKKEAIGKLEGKKTKASDAILATRSVENTGRLISSEQANDIVAEEQATIQIANNTIPLIENSTKEISTEISSIFNSEDMQAGLIAVQEEYEKLKAAAEDGINLISKEELEELKAAYESLEELIEIKDVDYEKGEEGGTKNSTKKATIKKDGLSADDFSKIQSAMKKVNKSTDDYNKRLKDANKTGKQLPKNIEEAEKKSNDLNKEAKKFSKSFNTKEMISNITQLTGGVWAAYSAIKNLSNISDIWNDEDLTDAEKMGQILMTIGTTAMTALPALKNVGTALMSFSNSAKDATAAQTILNGIMGTANAQQTASAITSLSAAGATKFLKESKEDLGDELYETAMAEIAETGAISTNTATTIANTLASKGQVGAEKAKKAATDMTTKSILAQAAAFMANPVVLIIVAIIAAIAALVAAFVILSKQESEEAKAAKAAAEAQRQLQKAYEDTKTAYDNLKKDITDYKNIKTSIEKLTAGTTEWKEAIQEANIQALELLQTYPELAKWVSRTKDGLINIDEEGLAKIQDDAFKDLMLSANAALSSNINLRDANLNLSIRNTGLLDKQFFNTVITNTYKHGIQEITEEEFYKAKEQLGDNAGRAGYSQTQITKGELYSFTKDDIKAILNFEDAIFATEENFKAAMENFQYSADGLSDAIKEDMVNALWENIESLDDLRDTIKANLEIQKTENTQYYSNLAQSRGLSATEASLYGGIISTNVTLDSAQIEKQIGERAKIIRSDTDDWAKGFASAMGYEGAKDFEVDGDSFTFKVGENEFTYDFEQASKLLARQQIMNEQFTSGAVEEARKLVETMTAGLSEESSVAIKTILTGSIADLEDYTMSNIIELENSATSQLNDLQKTALNETIKNLKDNLENINKNQGWLTDTDNVVAQLLGYNDWAEAMNSISIKIAKEIGGAVNKMAVVTGKEVAKVSQFIQKTGIDVTNFINSVDWNSETVFQDAIASIRKLGGELDYSDTNTYEMMLSLAELNGEMLLSKENFGETLSVIENLNSYGDSISSEEYSKLYEKYANAMDDYFTLMKDGTYALKSSAAEFYDMIQREQAQNLDTAINQELEALKNQATTKTSIEEELKKLTSTPETTNDAEKAWEEKLKKESYITIGGQRLSITDLNKTSGFDQGYIESIVKALYGSEGGLSIDGDTSLFDDIEWKNDINNLDNWKFAIQGTGEYNTDFRLDESLDQWGSSETDDIKFADVHAELLKRAKANYINNEFIPEKKDYHNKSEFTPIIQKMVKNGFMSSTEAETVYEWMNDKTNLLIENGESNVSKYIKDILARVDTTNADTSKLKDLVNSRLAMASSEEKFDEIITEYEKEGGLSSKFSSDEWDQIKKDAQESFNVEEQKRLTQRYENNKKILETTGDLIDQQITASEAIQDGLYGTKYTENIIETNLLLQKNIENLQKIQDLNKKELTRQLTFTGKFDETSGEYIKGTATDFEYAIRMAYGILDEDKDNDNSGLAKAVELSSIFQGLGLDELLIKDKEGKITGIKEDLGAEDLDLLLTTLTNLSKNDSLSEEQKTSLASYITTISDTLTPLINDGIKERIDEANTTIKNNLLDDFEYTLNLDLNKEEFLRTYNNFLKEISDINDFEQFGILADSNFDSIERQYNKIKASYDKLATLELNDATLQAKQEELLNQLMEKGIELKEAASVYEENILNYQEAINQAYEDYIGLLESADSILEHQASMYELMYGDDAYQYMSSYYNAQRENAMTINILRKEQYLQDKDDLEKAIASGDQELIDDARERFLSSEDAYMSSLVDLAQKYRDEYQNTVANSFADFEKKILIGDNTTTLSKLKEEYDWMNSFDEGYLDDIDKAFGISNVDYNFSKAINSTTNLSAQKKLNAAREEELKLLKEKDKLTQYDLDRAQKRLEITQAQIDLENAQQSKNQMRLVRGADGSYSYQYVADQSAIEEKQEELRNLQQELVNLDEEQAKSSIDKVWELYQEMIEKMKEASSEEEAQKIFNSYANAITDASGLAMSAIDLLKGSVSDASDILNTDFDFNLTMDWADSDFVKNFIEEVVGNGDQGFAGLFSSVMNEVMDGLTVMNQGEDGKGGIIGASAALSEAIDGHSEAIAGATENLKANLSNLNSDEMKTQIDSFISNLTSLNSTVEKTVATIAETVNEELTNIGTAKNYTVKFNYETDDQGKPTSTIAGFSIEEKATGATGLYTGEWGSEGKILMAHEKELLLNKTDTANILSAVDMVRSLTSALDASMWSSLIAQSFAAMDLYSRYMDKLSSNEQALDQNVHITAEFPNVSDKSEIEEAFNDLISLAAQHAYKDPNR